MDLDLKEIPALLKLIAVVFRIAKTGKQGDTQVSTERWMDKETVVYTHKGILSCLKKKKKKEILLFVTAWGDLEDIMLSEISQTQKDQHSMILHT